MFSNLILRNSHRSRKENGLFFSSLVISIVAFYMILSISTQDVMLFLQKMESDAVDKLLLLIPAFYGMTLGILFFLIYFACKYQFERRRHEFGVYLMLGMRRSKLFGMLLAEDFLTSILAMLIGLPVAVVLSEIVSLVTAKLVGMGIIGHQFSLSWSAIEWTLAGFLAIKLTALLILSGRISRQEIGTLLSQPTNRPKKQMPSVIYGLAAICGSVMLAVAYYMAIQGIAWTKVSMMGLTLLLGIVGTMLLFYGMRALIALIVKKGKGNKQLHVFTFRQIQENVIHQSTSMAISSLLILAALCCFGAGVGIAGTNSLSSGHVIDYTFEDHTAEDSSQVLPNIKAALKENGLENQFSELFEMRVGRIRTTEDYDNAYSMDAVMDSLRSLPQSEDRDVLLNNLGYATYPYLICLSDYNRLLELSGKPALQLGEKEAAVYIDTEFTTVSRTTMLNQVLAGQPKVELDGSPIHLTGEVQSVNLVTDRSITLSFALILPDEAFLYYSQGMYDMQSFLRKLDGIKSGDYLILAGSIPNTLPDDIYEQILERVGDRNINCVVDATGDLLKNVLKYKPFLIKPNHHELGDLFSVQIKSDDDIVKYSKKLQEMGAKNVLVSMAKDGAMLTDENGSVHKIGNAKGKLINSVGCGDSMVAGFTAGYIKTADYSYALRLGSACGNATAFSEKLATREEIERVFNAEYK